MTLKAIGTVRNEIKRPLKPDYPWEEVVSEIVVNDYLTDSLDNLDGFSHLIILWWMHQSGTSQLPAKVHPMGKPELPLVGLLATRSPRRPNMPWT